MTTKKRAMHGTKAPPVGIPLNPFIGLERDPAEWLRDLPGRIALFLEMRPTLSVSQVRDAKEAAEWARYAAKCIDDGNPGEAAQAAVRATLATHLVWCLVEQEGLIAKAGRDTKRQAGTGKARGSRRPALDAWLDKQLSSDPRLTDKVLWARLPVNSDDLWLDGDRVCEGNESDEGLTFEGFKKRATSARKRR
jgi:hypothetical protein